ncbi:MAG: energy transducer TonB [Bacteroidales bacterium]|nr:energy transducer TonB [Bacteroidales bacterium]
MKWWGGRNQEDRVGFYTTLVFHLAILVILLAFSVGRVATQEQSFVLDFTKQEELEKIQKEIELKEEVNKNLEDLLARQPRERIRNVAVDAGSKLRDDRFKNPSEVYDEARELQRKLDASRRDALAQQAKEEAVDLGPQKGEESSELAQAYQGPSVISYELDGRKALNLPVPAYKGYGAGDVMVDIEVNPAGRVTAARVRPEGSSADASLHAFAIDAAKRSRFSASTDAGKTQAGWILYRFIAQ